MTTTTTTNPHELCPRARAFTRRCDRQRDVERQDEQTRRLLWDIDELARLTESPQRRL